MSFPDLFRTLQVVFGIGLVIFVHEAGHFIAARMCKVRVDVFSLGFGPRLFGWRRGATLYQIAAIPVGGYVKMAGEMPDGSGRAPAHDELHAKGVWQRFFIYSGGVIMNVVFAIVVFPLVLLAGVPVLEPVVAQPTKGMPAWRAGLPEGTRIVAVDGEEVFDFFHIPNEVALAGDGPIEFTVLYPGGSTPQTVSIEPEYSENGGFRQIGVRPGVDPELRLIVAEDGPAAEAGLRTGDRFLGIPGAVEALSATQQLGRAFSSGEPFTVRAERDGMELSSVIEPELLDSKRRYFGIAPLSNRVRSMRENSWLELLGIELGDRIVRVDGAPIASGLDLFDALLEEGLGLEMQLQRIDPETGAVSMHTARSERRPTPTEVVAIDADLDLYFDPEDTLVFVQEGQAAEAAGLRTGDRLSAVGGFSVESWQDIFDQTRRAAKRDAKVEVNYDRRAVGADGAPIGSLEQGLVQVEPMPLETKRFGFDLMSARGIYRTETVGESITAGWTASWRFLTDAWLTLKRMAMGRVSTENLGGIITISAVSYDWASQGWAKLFFFLCMLSINLAFLNVLPIPVLDGGHLFFCVVEAVKGSPVSERTLGYSQLVGLVLILTLMVYVTYQDVMRIFPGAP